MDGRAAAVQAPGAGVQTIGWGGRRPGATPADSPQRRKRLACALALVHRLVQGSSEPWASPRPLLHAPRAEAVGCTQSISGKKVCPAAAINGPWLRHVRREKTTMQVPELLQQMRPSARSKRLVHRLVQGRFQRRSSNGKRPTSNLGAFLLALMLGGCATANGYLGARCAAACSVRPPAARGYSDWSAELAGAQACTLVVASVKDPAVNERGIIDKRGRSSAWPARQVAVDPSPWVWGGGVATHASLAVLPGWAAHEPGEGSST